MNKRAYWDGMVASYRRNSLSEDSLHMGILHMWKTASPEVRYRVAAQAVADMEKDAAGWETANNLAEKLIGQPGQMINKGMGQMINKGMGLVHQVQTMPAFDPNVGANQARQAHDELLKLFGNDLSELGNTVKPYLPYVVGPLVGALGGGAMGGWRGALAGAGAGLAGAYGYQQLGGWEGIKQRAQKQISENPRRTDTNAEQPSTTTAPKVAYFGDVTYHPSRNY